MKRDGHGAVVLAALAAAVMMVAPGPVRAAEDTWKSGVSGNFSDGTKWSDGSAPGAGDRARFNVAGSYTVTFTSNVGNQDLIQDQGTVTFTSSGGPWTYSLNTGGGMDVSLRGGSLTLGTSGNPLHLVAGDTLEVRTGGSLYVKYGSDVAAQRLALGAVASAATSFVVVDGSGSSLICSATSGYNFIGYDGGKASLTFQNSATGRFDAMLNVGWEANSSGSLTVQSNADLVLNRSCYIGAGGYAGEVGTVTVTGAGSTITLSAAAHLVLGAIANSTATLTLADSGALTTSTGETIIYKTGLLDINGGTLNANGEIFIDGGQLKRQAGTFNWAASKTMTIDYGGKASFTGSYTLPTGAVVNVTGTGSRLETLSAGYLAVSGGSQVNVTSGGAAASAAYLDVTSGTLLVDGSGSSASGAGVYASYWGSGGGTGLVTFRDNATGSFPGGVLLVANAVAATTGTLSVESGADLALGNFYVGTPGGSTTATATVTGAGSTIVQSGASVLEVGHATSGTATLNILSSGAFTTGTGQTTIRKTGLVDINGGTLSAGGNILIDGGQLKRQAGTFTWAASKTMTIQAGGKASFTGSCTLPTSAIVNVTGTGSTLETLSGGNLAVSASGQVSVTAGGLLAAAGALDVGSIALVDINGGTLSAGGNILINGGQLKRQAGTFTWADSKTMTIQNGGKATFTGHYSLPVSATVNISGAGSRLETLAGDGLLISGSSQVNVTAGGLLLPDQYLHMPRGTLVVDGTGSSASCGTEWASWWGYDGGTASLTFRNGATGAFPGGAILVANSIPGTTGTLSVESGASLTLGEFRIGTAGGSTTATATVTGTGSTINAGVVSVGYASRCTASLNVLSGSTFASGAINIYKTGVVDINGGTFNAGGDILINGGHLKRQAGTFAWAGSKTMTIQGGGKASFTGHYTLPSSATVNITGAGSRLETLSSGDLIFSQGSQVNITGGGLASVARLLDISTGSLVVDGPDSSVWAGLWSYWGAGGGTASVTFRNSATGNFPGGVWLVAGAAAGTTGTLSVETGAALALASFYIGTEGGATTATATVTGTGSAITQSGASVLMVGHASEGAATLHLLSGGTYTTGTGLTTIKKTGLVNIDGGTLNANANILIDGGQLKRQAGTFNWAASKTMTIQNGGKASFTGTYALPSSAIVNISGAGSTLETLSDGALTVAGASQVTVTAGGLVSAAGYLDVWTGTLLVDGAGSSAVSGAAATSSWGGAGGTASVIFSSGATGDFPGGVMLMAGLTSGSAATLSVESGADLALGHFCIGIVGGSTSATATVAGAGSTITQPGGSLLIIGHPSEGTATLNVLSGGTFTTGTGETAIYKTGLLNLDGGTFSALGDILLDGGQLKRQAGTFNWAASKTMTIQGGGKAAFTGDCILPTGSTVNVTGAGSTLETLSGGVLEIQGGSQVSVTAGGALAAAGYLEIGTVGSGTLVVDNAAASAVGGICLWGAGGSTASVTFRAGAAGTFGGGVGLAADATAGTTGTLTVESDADLALGDFYVGTEGGSITATATVTGAGSTITQSGASLLTVGHATSGTATLSVLSGATYTTGTGLTTINKSGLVDVSGGTLSAKGDIFVNGGQLKRQAGTFTWAGSKVMTVQGGGAAAFTGNYALPSSAGVYVHGTGSKLETLSGGDLTVSPDGQVAVTDGGLLSAAGCLHVQRGNLIVAGLGSGASAGSATTNRWGSVPGTTVVTFCYDATGDFPGGITLGATNMAGTQAYLNVESGADLVTGHFLIGTFGGANSYAIANVMGAGSTITQPGSSSLVVGHAIQGSGTLNVYSDSTFTTGTGQTTIRKTGLVDIDGGTLNAGGNILIDGGQLKRQAGTLNWAASKTMTVQAGGTATFMDGYTLPTGATVSVAGAGSKLETLSGGNFAVPVSAQVSVTSGGLLEVAGAMTSAGSFSIGTGSSATIAGAFTQTAGSTVADGLLRSLIGQASVQGGTLTLSGPQEWVPGSVLAVSGSSTVNLNSGAGTPATASTPAVANLTLSIAGGTVNLGATQDLSDLAITASTLDLKDQLVRLYTVPGQEAKLRGLLQAGKIIDSLKAGDEAVGYTDQRMDAYGTPYVAIRAVYVGDTNLDGKVSFADFSDLLANYGGSGKTWDLGDFNYDGQASFADFTDLLANYGKTGGNHVPEPATLALLAAGGTAVLAGGRRRGRKSRGG